MKVHGVQASPERRILLGMLVNDAVCGRIASRWEEEGLFKTKMGNTLGGMAVDYYSRYDKAPLHNIEAIARSWAEGKSDDLVDELDGFLRTVDYEKLAKTCNADYVIDQAAEYFSQVKLQRLFDAGSGFLLKGDTKKAQSLIDGFLPVEMGTGSWIDPLSDDEAIRRVFEQDRDSLITFPDGLGKFFGRSLKRDALVAMMGAAKRGKSWLLLNIVFMAILQKRKVAYFECGDLTQDEVIERLLTRMAGRPLVINGDATRYTYKIPKTLQVDKGRVMIDYIEKTVKRSLTFEKLKEIRDRFREEYEADKLLRLSVHSTSSLSIPAMRTILSRWEREGWSADCIVIDYADILAPPIKNAVESRDQINATWKMMSKMRQELHCLVVTATQADADSYDADILKRSNFTDDRRKHDHVTAMLGINQTSVEKERGIYRLNWLDRRGETYSEREVCYTAGCLDIADPFIKSWFKEE